MRRLGVHTSIAGGLHKALERAEALGCNTMQIFSHNPRGWAIQDKAPGEEKHFRTTRKLLEISPVFIHTSYLINLASSDKGLIEKSVSMTAAELSIADSIGAEYVILHTGSASGDDPLLARQRAIRSLREVSERVDAKAGLLLENTAGERGDITSRISDLAEIMDKVPGGLIRGICLDTCHAFSAGYDLRTDAGFQQLCNEIDSTVGRGAVKLIHLNDSRGDAGSGRDRHEHIGEGMIGLDAFRRLLQADYFKDVPVILETPKKDESDDPRNLAVVRRLMKQT